MPSTRTKQRLDEIKLGKRLRRAVGRAIDDYRMISAGDRILVGVSGGKDSFTLVDLLWNLRRSAPVDFELVAVNLDQGQPGFPAAVLEDYFRCRGIPFQTFRQDTHSVVTRVIPADKTRCSLCSRLRRGSLYTYAARQGFTKIALGHHRDDILETFLMNLFHGGTLKAMPAKLRSDDGRHILIRPLAYCRERDIAAYAKRQAYPIIPCDLCGSQSNLERARMKALITEWSRANPGRVENMFRALQHIAPSQLLDRNLFDFDALEPNAREAASSAGFLRPRKTA